MFQESVISNYLRQNPEIGRVVVDVGACDGRYLDLQALRFRHVYAIEPEAGNFRFLCKRAGFFNNVTCLNKAVGAYEGYYSFWKHSNPMVHTINPVIVESKSGWVDTEAVRGTTLDQLWSEIKGNGETIGFLVFDAEGAEDFAFDHAEELLDENRDWLWIVLETHDGVDLQRLYQLFSEKGYDCSLNGIPVSKLERDRHYLLRKKI